MSDSPTIIILAGPNGSGKTTAARGLLPEYLGLKTFVNADEIARGLSPFDPDLAAREAGLIMLQRMKRLCASRQSFALETTLAGRSYLRWIQRRLDEGYLIQLFFFWVKHPDLAVKRVEQRARAGGHAIAEDVVRERYRKSTRNFGTLYSPLASQWQLLDNSHEMGPVAPIARGEEHDKVEVFDHDLWMQFFVEATDEH